MLDHEFQRAQWTGFKSSGQMTGGDRTGDTDLMEIRLSEMRMTWESGASCSE